MDLHERTLCEEVLLDLVCYEIYRGHLSPEMEHLFDGHVEKCPSCRDRVRVFRWILGEGKMQRNLG